MHSANGCEFRASVIATDGPAVQQQLKQRRQYRQELYEQVITLHGSGHTQKAIGATVGISLKTIRRWLRAGQFPERKPVLNRHSHVREFAGYLEQRWKQGCHNSTQLFREIRSRGYRGSRQMVSYFVAQWRKRPQNPGAKRLERLAPKQATILLCKRAHDRSATEQQLFERLIDKNPTFALIHTFAIDFRDTLQR